MTEDELQAALEKAVPERDRYDLFVEECGDQDVRLRFSPAKGEVWRMPAFLAMVDTVLRAAAGVEASVTHLSLTVLGKAHDGVDVLALSRVLRRDGDSVHAEAWLFSHAVVEVMIHATATLHIPLPR